MSTQCKALLKVAKPSEVLPGPEGRYSCFARKAMEEATGLVGTDLLIGSRS